MADAKIEVQAVIDRLTLEWRERLIALASYAATCKSENTPEWMRGLAEHLNAACESLGDPTRFHLAGGRYVDDWYFEATRDEP